MNLYREDPATGTRQYPHINRDGRFVLGDPSGGQEKHHRDHKVMVDTESEAVDLIRRGYSIRVKTPNGTNMVRLNLFLAGVRLT